MVILCGVCEQQPPKYRCPSCQLQYCSLACYKSHKLVHDTAPPAPDASVSSEVVNEASAITTTTVQPSLPAQHPQQEPAPTPQPTPTNPFEALRNHPSFSPLFTRYPALQSQLRTVYNATLEPPEGHPEPQRRFRGGFSGRHHERSRGPWPQEKADAQALKILRAMKRDERDGEGLKEFGELVGMVCGREGGSDAVDAPSFQPP